MPTYDLHQHLWPEAFVDALRARRSLPLLDGDELVTAAGRFAIDPSANGLERRLRLLDELGIDVAVISLQTTLGLEALAEEERERLEQAWADGVTEIAEGAEGRLLALSPSRSRDGFVGVSVPASALLELDSSEAALREAGDRDGFVFVHPDAGTPAEGRPEWWDWVVGYPARMQAAYLSWLEDGRARLPTTRVLFAILAGGGPFLLERATHEGLAVRSALDPNTYFDVSTNGRRAIELCIETFGVTQIAYGSDVPVVDPQPTLDAVRGFGDAVVNVLQTETPTALLR